MAPELTVVIVNWNGGDVVQRAVASFIHYCPAVAFQIVIVDNASTDGSVDALEAQARGSSHAGQLSVIRLSENFGFGRANNLAFRQNRSPFVLLLNPDTETTEGSIDVLLRTLREHPRAGAVGPRLIDRAGRTQTSVWHNPPGPLHLLLDGFGLHRLMPSRMRGELLLGRHWAHDRLRRVPMISAAAMAVRREAIDATGGFDERFHMYGEDNDWCARLTKKGFDLLFQPSAAVIHLDGYSTQQRWNTLEKHQVQLDAHFEFQRTHLSRTRVVLNDAAASVAMSGARLWSTLSGRDSTIIDATLVAHARDLQRTLYMKR